MDYRVDHHFKPGNDLVITNQYRHNKYMKDVWLSSTSYTTDFTIEFTLDHLNILRRLVSELEYIEAEMHQAELANDALEADKMYESSTPITIPSEPAW